MIHQRKCDGGKGGDTGIASKSRDLYFSLIDKLTVRYYVFFESIADGL